MSLHEIIRNGTNEELDKAMYGGAALGVDRKSEEPEVLREMAKHLPGFTFTPKFDTEGTCHVELRYGNRTAQKAYTNIPYNCFRILLDVEALIEPDAEMRVYEPTMGSTTHTFAVGSRAFWERFDREASVGRKQRFQPVSFLDQAWELSGPGTRSKKWWQFWK
jgi:hypothetical protein